ncbi:MAG: hypothetical protein AB7G47_05985 [Mycolicibacterium sp.]|uniref:hypothetical protein n=1 Tax=Mycolicibacterium sp. TaxID=2320850 RepID=UPI003D140DCA
MLTFHGGSYVYITQYQNSSSVSVLDATTNDATTNTVTDTIILATGSWSIAIVTSPGGNYAYVANNLIPEAPVLGPSV